jgi:hypothetical protein
MCMCVRGGEHACVREGRCWGQVRQWTKHGFVRLFAKGRRETSGDGDSQVCGDNKWGSGEGGGRCAEGGAGVWAVRWVQRAAQLESVGRGGGDGQVEGWGQYAHVCVRGAGNAVRCRGMDGAVQKRACQISGGDGRGQGEQQAAVELAKGGRGAAKQDVPGRRKLSVRSAKQRGEAICWEALRRDAS